MPSPTTTWPDDPCDVRQGQSHDELLAHAFLRASRRPGAAVVAVNERVIMATACAALHVTTMDQSALWRWARAGESGDGQSLDVQLPNGARSEALIDGQQLAGFLVDLAPASDACPAVNEATFASVLPGESHAVRTVRAQLGALVETLTDVLIAGATGTEKEIVARTLLDLDRRAIVEFDCTDSRAESWSEMLAQSLRCRRGVILANLDEMVESVVPAVASALDQAGPQCRVVATTSTEDVHRLIARSFPARVHLPALRDRPEDLPEIAAAILARHRVRSQIPRLGVDARRLLWGYQWPGDVTELTAVLRNAVRLAPTAVIDESLIRLPRGDGPRVTPRRTALMKAERNALIEALERCDGNKLAAADLLGMARSTLYRKLRALAIA